MASMAAAAGLCGSTQAVLEGSSRQISGGGSRRLTVGPCSSGRLAAVGKPATVKAQQQASAEEAAAGVPVKGRRAAALGLVAAGVVGGSFVQAVLAEARPIKLGPPPPLSGGLPGTLNSDEPRDLDLPLKDRFYLQPLPADKAAARAKESAQDILNVKNLIAKKEWPYVMNDLRLKGSYLRYDLGTVISSKPKAEKKDLTDLTKSLFDKISDLDHAAKIKSVDNAQKSYAEVKSALDSVIAKLG